MYECPNECGSATFIQKVVQKETVEADGAGGVLNIDVNDEPVLKELTCAECGAEVEIGE